MIEVYAARYVGPNAKLKEKTALVRIEGHEVQDMESRHGEILCRTLMAQFDDVSTGLGFGWHRFDVDDFEKLEGDEEER